MYQLCMRHMRYGSFTVGYSNYEFDNDGTASDDDTSSYKVSYAVSDELSVSLTDQNMS